MEITKLLLFLMIGALILMFAMVLWGYFMLRLGEAVFRSIGVYGGAIREQARKKKQRNKEKGTDLSFNNGSDRGAEK